MSGIEKIKRNADVARQTIADLKSELNLLSNEYNTLLARELREENAKLLAAVEEARLRLIHLETDKGIPQFSVPTTNATIKDEAKPPAVATSEKNQEAKPPKKEKSQKAPPKEAKPTAPIDIGRLDLRVAAIETVERHPDADTLYLLKINCGEEKPRTVCSGLVKHVPIEDLKDRQVILLCNLKPVKMRGILSEAMVMCASSEQCVEVLSPPQGCAPGDSVECDGFARNPDRPVMNPKHKVFEGVAPDLRTDGTLKACYKGVPWSIPSKGPIVAKSLANVPIK